MPKTDSPSIVIPANFVKTEKGNTYLYSDEGNHVAWFTLEGDIRLEVSITPENSPAFYVSTIVSTDVELAAHINENCEGWNVGRLNVEGVKVDEEGFVTV